MGKADEVLRNSFNEGNNSLNISIQDQTTPSVEHYLYEELADVTIVNSLNRRDNVITLESGHGFVGVSGLDKEHLNIYYSDDNIGGFVGYRFSQHTVVGVNGNDISITPPIPYDLNISNVVSSKRVNTNLAVNGTFSNARKFCTRAPQELSWDLTGLLGSMVLTTAPDDGLFGNLPVLTNGIYFGFENENFVEYNISLFDNGSLRNSAFLVDYATRSGGQGDYGMSFWKKGNGLDNLGVVVRLEGLSNDIFCVYVQDDLTDIELFRIRILGHIVD